MAGPSQAGRFKPRKPAKKIRVGAASAPAPAAASSDVPSASSNPQKATSASSSRSSSKAGRGGRGGGRGRGGRAPTPHGAVFFTGNAAPPTAAARKKSATTSSSSSSSATSGAKKSGKGRAVKKKESMEEIVVGQLDVAIGGSATEVVNDPAKEETEKKSTRQTTSDGESSSTRKTSKFQPLVDTYDSDSSDEAMETTESQASTSLPPTELPFPVAPLPVGIGQHGGPQRCIMYSCQDTQNGVTETTDPVMMESQNDPPLVSPFVDWNDAKLREQERDSWFLLQFPTRLPSIVPSSGAAVPDPVNSESSVTPDETQSTAVGVATPSANTGCFDNTLAQAPAGRLGRLVVYKSGKTELVMGGDNGSPEIRMNVTEGLPCGFVQQAVAIDTDESTYIPLGDVKRTVVVTPNVKSAFASTTT